MTNARAPAPVWGWPHLATVGGRPAAEAGFTLLELLIAMTLVATIALLLFSGLRLGSRAWEAVAARGDSLSAISLARGFIQRSLLESRAVRVQVGDAEQLVFAGQETAMEYVAPLSRFVGAGGLFVLRLSLERREDRQQLLLTRWLLHPDVLVGNAVVKPWEPLGQASPGPVRSPDSGDRYEPVFGQSLLLDNVGGLSFSYYGQAEREREAQWHDEWLEQPRPPLLVKVHLVSGPHDWPDLIVPLPDG